MARWQSWSIASDLKSDESLRIPWVRIPLSPLLFKIIELELNTFYMCLTVSKSFMTIFLWVKYMIGLKND